MNNKNWERRGGGGGGGGDILLDLIEVTI